MGVRRPDTVGRKQPVASGKPVDPSTGRTNCLI